MTANELERLLEAYNVIGIVVNKDMIEIEITDKLNEENIRKVTLNTRMVWVKQWYESIINEEL